ncbi:MAG: sodium:solute symporter, partial [Flavobacteriaceae bacterium]
AYSSADSALTSLTTSFCVDFLNLEKYSIEDQKKVRKRTHIGMSLMLILVVILFKHILDRNVIDGLLTVAGYTYGPLLGLFSFGIFTNYKIHERYIWLVLIGSLGIISAIGSLEASTLGGYELGYELLPLNGLITFLGLILIRRK